MNQGPPSAERLKKAKDGNRTLPAAHYVLCAAQKRVEYHPCSASPTFLWETEQRNRLLSLSKGKPESNHMGGQKVQIDSARLP